MDYSSSSTKMTTKAKSTHRLDQISTVDNRVSGSDVVSFLVRFTKHVANVNIWNVNHWNVNNLNVLTIRDLNRLVAIQHSRMGNQGIRDVSVSICVLPVPIYRLFQTFLPRHLFDPSEIVQLGRVDGVTQVIEGAVRDELDPLFFLVL